MGHIKIWRAIASSSTSAFAPNISFADLMSWNRYRGSTRTIPDASVLSSSSTGSKTEQQEWFLILEDDAALRLDPVTRAGSENNLTWSIFSAIQSLPVDADVLYLGHAIPKKAKFNATKDKMFFKPNFITQLHSYMITKKTAGILLSFLPVDCPVDIFLARLIHDKIITVCILYL
jgi:hypothetical protein